MFFLSTSAWCRMFGSPDQILAVNLTAPKASHELSCPTYTENRDTCYIWLRRKQNILRSTQMIHRSILYWNKSMTFFISSYFSRKMNSLLWLHQINFNCGGIHTSISDLSYHWTVAIHLHYRLKFPTVPLNHVRYGNTQIHHHFENIAEAYFFLIGSTIHTALIPYEWNHLQFLNLSCWSDFDLHQNSIPLFRKRIIFLKLVLGFKLNEALGAWLMVN